MKTTILTTTAVALMASLTFAAAQDRGAKFDFTTIDADGNGEITQAEITAFGTAKFAEVDTNGDGALSKEELVAQYDGDNAERAERRIDRMFSRLDANEDGAISLEERQASERLTRVFERLDSDDSGTISAEEAEKVADRGGRDGKRGKGKGGKDKRGSDKS